MCGIASDKVKERLLREQELTLGKAIHICKAEEESKKQMQYLHASEDSPNPVTTVHAMRHSKSKPVEASLTQTKADSQHPCHYCGWIHPKEKCPAFGKKCLNCGKLNHFSKQCRLKKKVTRNDTNDTNSHTLIGQIKKTKTESMHKE